MKYAYLSILFILILACNSIAQNLSADNTPVAEMTALSLSSEEFLNRFELCYPFKSSDAGNRNEEKHQYLLSLLSEKLWSRYALEKHLDTLQDVTKTIAMLSRFYCLDQLYKDSIESKVTISVNDVQKAMEKLQVTLFIQMIKSESETEIKQYYNRLLSGEAFADLMKQKHGYNVPFPIVFGQLGDAEIEDAVYNLQNGMNSKPLKSGDMYMLVKVTKKEPNEYAGKKRTELQNIAEYLIKRRGAMQLQTPFLQNHLQNERVEVDGKLYPQLAKELFRVLRSREMNDSAAYTSSLKLTPEEYGFIRETLGVEKLRSPFILFTDNPLTLNDFIDYIPFLDIRISVLRPLAFDKVLKAEIQKLIEREILYRLSVKYGYQNHPSVVRRTNFWKENLLAEKAKEIFLQSSMNEPFNRLQSVNYIRVREIAHPYLESIDTVLQLLNSGERFEHLQMLFHKPDYADFAAAVTDWVPVHNLTLPYRGLAQVHAGHVFGPVLSSNAYHLLWVEEKTTRASSANADSLQSSKAFMQVMFERIDKKTAELAVQYGLKLHEDVLQDLKVTGINMITIEQLGFGAKLPAFPYTPKDYGWFKQYEKLTGVKP